MTPENNVQSSEAAQFRERGLNRIPLFDAIKDEGSIAALMRGIESHVCAPNFQLVSQGHYTNKLWVVLRGLVDRYRTEPGGASAQHLGKIQAGEWFGESCALSNQPALYSIETQSDCTLLSVDAATFKAIYKKKSEKEFRRIVDARYRETSLAAHLRIIPLFQDLSEREVRKLRERVEFEMHPADSVIASSGQPAEAVYLVRSGAVQCIAAEEKHGREQVVGYYMDNACFGERSMADGEPKWLGTFKTLAPTDVVKIPAALIRELISAESSDQLTSVASSIATQESGSTPGFFDRLKESREKGLSLGERERLELMVSKGSAKGGNALVIDLTKCVRCNACVESCVAVHADRVPRLSKTGNRISKEVTLASACYHCTIPECMMACNYGAIRRDLRGTIDFVWDNCVGCTSCVEKCPYNVIRMTHPPTKPDESKKEKPKQIDYPSALARLPVIGHLFQPANKEACAPKASANEGSVNKVTGLEEQVTGKAVKCDLCAGMPFEACVYNCPCSAISRVSPEDLFNSPSA